MANEELPRGGWYERGMNFTNALGIQLREYEQIRAEKDANWQRIAREAAAQLRKTADEIERELNG